MSLIKTILLPHSPLLIPEIGKANHDLLQKTSASYQRVAEDLKQAKIETIIIISPHGKKLSDGFNINVSPEMKIDLKEFGFMPPHASVSGDMIVADKIKSGLQKDWNVHIISEDYMDHGAAIPAYILKQILPEFKLIVITPAEELSLDKQMEFGEKLGQIIKSEEKRIALIASGDLSHRLKKKSPGGYSPKGAKFDNKIIEYLNEASSAKENILKMDSQFIAAAGECGLNPIAILLGALDGIQWQPDVLSYQNDFGVGYLSMDFII